MNLTMEPILEAGMPGKYYTWNDCVSLYAQNDYMMPFLYCIALVIMCLVLKLYVEDGRGKTALNIISYALLVLSGWFAYYMIS